MARAAKIKTKLQMQLEEGTIDLISFQQAVGGSVLSLEKTVTDVDQCSEDLPIDVSRKGPGEVVVSPRAF